MGPILHNPSTEEAGLDKVDAAAPAPFPFFFPHPFSIEPLSTSVITGAPVECSDGRCGQRILWYDGKLGRNANAHPNADAGR